MDAHNNLGVVYGKKGLLDKAEEHFKASIKLNPDDSYSYHNLAKVYEMKGLKDKAEKVRRMTKN